MPTLSKVLRELAQTCAPDLSAREAVRQLQTSGADLLLVEQNGTVLGMFGHREAVAVYADGSAPSASTCATRCPDATPPIPWKPAPR